MTSDYQYYLRLKIYWALHQHVDLYIDSTMSTRYEIGSEPPVSIINFA